MSQLLALSMAAFVENGVRDGSFVSETTGCTGNVTRVLTTAMFS